MSFLKLKFLFFPLLVSLAHAACPPLNLPDEIIVSKQKFPSSSITSFSVSGQVNSESLGVIQVNPTKFLAVYDWIDTEGKKIFTTNDGRLTQSGFYFSVFNCENQRIGMIVQLAYVFSTKIRYAIRDKNNKEIAIFSPTNQEETFFKAEDNGRTIATIRKSHNKDEWHITIYDHNIIDDAMLVMLTTFFSHIPN